MSEEFFAKSQMYYNGYFPGGVYRLRNYSFVQVVGTRNNDEDTKAIDEEQLLDVARKYKAEWDGMPNGEVSGTLKLHLEQAGRYIQIMSPEAVYVEPFPMMLQCTSCKVLDFYQGNKSNTARVADAKKRLVRKDGKQRIRCKMGNCNGYMVQLEYVAVHRCGHMSTLTIPGAARRVQNLGFRDQGGSFRNSMFYDIDNPQNASFHSLQENCPHCSREFEGAEGLNKRATPIGSKEVIFPHNIQYLSLKPDTGKLVSRVSSIIGAPGDSVSALGLDIAEGIASCLIGLVQSGELVGHMDKLLTGGGPDKDAIEKIADELAEKKKQKDDIIQFCTEKDASKSMLSIMIEPIDKEIFRLEEELLEASGKFSGVRDYIDDSVKLQFLASHRRAIESVLIEHDFKTKRQSMTDSIKKESNELRRDQLIQDSGYLKQRYGIGEIAHYSEINVVMASIGYSREKMQPGEGAPGQVVPTVLLGYEDQHNKSMAGKSVVYALPAKTEAIQIKLDPRAVLAWCIEAAGWSDPGKRITESEDRAKAYLLDFCAALTMDPAEVMSEIKGRPMRESAPFHLMHTISHCLLGCIKRHTGYGEKSVMEYLMPMDLSIILYVASVQNYTAGGLLTLFKHHLRTWFDDASNYAFNCVFDPICSDKGSSCSGCVQIVLGCETFNHGLSRCYIHGGKLEEGTKTHITKGFWG